jgi:glycerol-3-phosphate dehydrogenase
MIFVVPFGAFTYIGTTDTDYTGPLDDVHADAADISYILGSVKEAFENVHLAEDDILSTWAGLRPLVNEEGNPSAVSRDYEIALDNHGLVTIAGGKLTTYRSMAETLLDEILTRFADRFEQPFAECQTAKASLHGGEIADFKKHLAGAMKGLGRRWGLSPAIIEHLLRHYGTEYLNILSLGLSDRKFLQPLSNGNTVLQGEVIYAVEDEMAMTLEDFMERRTDLMHFDSVQGLDVATEVARLMGMRLRWDGAEMKRQLEAYRNAVEKMTAFRRNQASVIGPPAKPLTTTVQRLAIEK